MKKIFLSFTMLLGFYTMGNAQISNGPACTFCKNNDMGVNSSALGSDNESTGLYSLVSGYKNQVTGDYSHAFGYMNTVSNLESFAAGYNNSSNGIASICLGTECTTFGKGAFAAGMGSIANGVTSFALGQNVKTGGSTSTSFVIGEGNSNTAYLVNDVSHSLMIGFTSSKPTFFVSQAPGYNKTGRIGIGNITAPEAKLHIRADNDEDASLYLQLTGTGNFAKLYLGDLSHSIIASEGTNMEFNITTGNDFVFNTGNVGIGTITPTEKLEVNGNILQTTGFNISSSQIKAPDANGLTLTNQNGNGLFVDNAGNIGVGTLTPLEKLYVSDGNIAQTPGYYLSTSQIKAPDANGLNLTNQGGNGLFVDDAGNVGIGTLAPATKFEVSGTTTLDFSGGNIAGNALIVKSGDEQLKLVDVGDGDYCIIGNEADNTYIKTFDNLGSEGASLFLNKNGNMGIGTSTPETELEINGELSVSENANIGSSYKRLSIGSANGSDLHYGTSYIGFNIERKSVNNWITGNDYSHNGAAVIYGTINGDLIFSCIQSNGSSNQSLNDNEIKTAAKIWLTKDGILKTKEVLIETDFWSDYVFYDGYRLASLDKVERFIKENKHLPDTPSESEVVENGINLGEMDALLMKKIEELTLYVIELKKQNNEMQSEINELKK